MSPSIKEAEIISEQRRVTFPRPSERWQFKGYINWPPDSQHKAATVWTHRLIVNLNVLRSISKMRDQSVWVHISIAHPNRMPTYEDLAKVKEDFIGDDREAYQVFAAKQDHVNAHEYCLHLFAPIDDRSKISANLQNLIGEDAL